MSDLERTYVYLQVVPGRAGGGSFRRKKKYLFYLVDFFKHIRKHAFTQTSKTPRTFSFYTSTGEVKPHVTLDGWARHSAPGLSLVNHKLNNFCMYSLDTICTEGYYFTQRAIGHIQFLTQPWWQLILGVVREIIIGI